MKSSRDLLRKLNRLKKKRTSENLENFNFYLRLYTESGEYPRDQNLIDLIDKTNDVFNWLKTTMFTGTELIKKNIDEIILEEI